MKDSKFIECDSCREKAGSPVLCGGCVHNRDVIERLTPKTKSEDPRFDEFYKEYPLKKSKAPARKAWSKIRPDGEMFETIMTALRAQKKSKQWQCKQYIPHPSTWLNQERWDDEVEPSDELPTNNKYEGI